jgi:ankyrin repeat protein
LKKAAKNGNREAVKMLIKQGADIETSYYFGCPPLYWGAYL